VRSGGSRARTSVALLALIVGAVACGPPLQPLAIPGRDGGPRQTGGASTGQKPRDVRMDAKRVAGKEPPTTLIADDGMRCVVTEARYRDTKIGDEAWCVWQYR
jgi:hypothetical protein